MNTRLQVEHPVTEAVAGVDLVRAQFIVAEGGRLPWTQDALSQRGHAMECRIYAEDPAHGFLPQAGPLLLYREPSGPGIRVDSGVTEGDRVGVNYDPLLAKLIVHGETREAARIARACTRCGNYPVLGTRTNIPFLIRLLELPAFRAGRLHTGMIEEHLCRAHASRTMYRRRRSSPRRSRPRRVAGARDADGSAAPRQRPLVDAPALGTVATCRAAPSCSTLADDDRQYRVDVIDEGALEPATARVEQRVYAGDASTVDGSAANHIRGRTDDGVDRRRR